MKRIRKIITLVVVCIICLLNTTIIFASTDKGEVKTIEGNNILKYIEGDKIEITIDLSQIGLEESNMDEIMESIGSKGMRALKNEYPEKDFIVNFVLPNNLLTRPEDINYLKYKYDENGNIVENKIDSNNILGLGHYYVKYVKEHKNNGKYLYDETDESLEAIEKLYGKVSIEQALLEWSYLNGKIGDKMCAWYNWKEGGDIAYATNLTYCDNEAKTKEYKAASENATKSRWFENQYMYTYFDPKFYNGWKTVYKDEMTKYFQLMNVAEIKYMGNIVIPNVKQINIFYKYQIPDFIMYMYKKQLIASGCGETVDKEKLDNYYAKHSEQHWIGLTKEEYIPFNSTFTGYNIAKFVADQSKKGIEINVICTNAKELEPTIHIKEKITY